MWMSLGTWFTRRVILPHQVVAAAQAGKHNEKRESYGDSLIIDPWGRIIARLPDRLSTGIAIADIDLSNIESVRMRMPISEVCSLICGGCWHWRLRCMAWVRVVVAMHSDQGSIFSRYKFYLIHTVLVISFFFKY
ncbi:uncharacterized protein LOC120273577 isoform X2 [Dioscorea cayenensis subsp. rotundata]|nr:uncharacterized protein LOC120273577 isoform X2 [Dioscorea cayenensis subsp. rotundata]